MNICVSESGTSRVAVIDSTEVIIHSVQDALDLMSTVRYLHGCDKMVLPEAAVIKDFFDLKTRLAGEVLQKFTNYHMQLAIVGDFEACRSKSLHDFIYESNQGKQVFFLPDEQTALARLHGIA